MNALALLGMVGVGVGDPGGTRTVVAIVVLLAVLGIALVVLAFWFRHSTRPDPEVLAPLEVMSERSWRTRDDPEWQQRRLDEVRPAGAAPVGVAATPDPGDAPDDLSPPESADDSMDDEAMDDEAMDDEAMDDETTVAGVAERADDGRDTPPSLQRLLRFEEEFERDFDQKLVEQAMEEIEAELRQARGEQ